jgi:hypothetical protein
MFYNVIHLRIIKNFTNVNYHKIKLFLVVEVCVQVEHQATVFHCELKKLPKFVYFNIAYLKISFW